MGKKNNGPRASIKKRELAEQVLSFLSSHPDYPFSLKNVFNGLKLSTHPLRMLCVDILNELIDSGEITRNRDGNIVYKGAAHTIEGTFCRTSGGRNFVDTNEGMGVAIYDEDTHHALPGDYVEVSIHAKKRGSSKLRGQITRILKHTEQPFVGILQTERGATFLATANEQLLRDIIIPYDKLNGAKNGDKVVVKATGWPMNERNPSGEVVEVLGKEGDNDTEMHAILAEYGLPYKYPEEVEAEAARIDAGITPDEIARREDFRDTFTITIDPRDAKDFDDAISIKKLKDGLWEVGVHIADVSHYVTEGSGIDREAQQRATSIYLVDRTIPMLPEHLCNQLCSLRPDEEKLTFSVIFEMNDEAEILSHRIRHTVIKSSRRYTYEEVQYLLEQNGEATECELIRQGLATPTQPVPAQEVLPDTELNRFRDNLSTINPESIPVTPLPDNSRKGENADLLITLNRMAQHLRKERFKHGSINFDREEPRFETDEKGKPIRVYFKHAKDANKLVEEFMLLANRTVAESVAVVKKGLKPKTLPYRIHDMPDINKLDNLAAIAARLGFNLVTQGKKTDVAHSLNKLLRDIRGNRMQNLVELASLRAMQKAVYSTYNIGHYGLGFDYYTHFTSPIRRYPDLMVHRLLTRYAEGAESASQKKYENLCEHSSKMEQLAATAERSSIKYKQVEFMADKLGEEFDAHISGVNEFGIYAEIDENHCEGFIAVRFLGNEAFNFDDRSYCLTGRQTHTRFSLGDPIRIRVAQANLFRKQLDYDLVEHTPTLYDDTPPPFYRNIATRPKAPSPKNRKGTKKKLRTKSSKKGR